MTVKREALLRSQKVMSKTTYSAFYPSRRYWAGEAVNFQDRRNRTWFFDQMAEEVFSAQTPQLTLKVCRDGRIMMRINALERSEDGTQSFTQEAFAEMVGRWGQYLDRMNVFYLLLDSALLELRRLAHFNLHEITFRDAFRVTFEDDRPFSENIAIESIASVFQMERNLAPPNAAPNPAALPLELDHRFMQRFTVEREVIQHAFEGFTAATESPGLIEKLALFAKSLSEYKVGNYETALVLSWFVIEAAINTLWANHLKRLDRDIGEGRKRINSKRREMLTGRDYTSSVMSNMLELWEILSDSLFLDVDAVRGHRNRIVHGDGYQPTAEHAQLALNTAQAMIDQLWGFRFKPNLSFSVSGL